MTAWPAHESLAPSDGARPRALWDALLDGDVTIVDSYDDDGRRIVVARRNKMPLVNGSRLSPVERAIVRWVSIGGAQKIIALELGLSPAAVSDALSRGIAKLGLAAVSDLTRVAAALGLTHVLTSSLPRTRS